MKRNVMVIIVTLLMAWSQKGETAWVFKPASSNARKGDVILSRKPDSAVAKVIAALGQYWDHCMMVVDEMEMTDENGNVYIEGTMMTDNSFEQSYLESIIINKTAKIRIPLYIASPLGYKVKVPDKFNPIKLSNLSRNKKIVSAIITGNIRGKGNKGRIMALLTVKSEENRTHVEKIADIMKNMKGYYNLNAYVKLKDFVPLSGDGTLSPGQGSHCSGTIWWANHIYGKEMDLFTLDNRNDVLSGAANAMHTYVRNYVRDMIYDEIKANKYIIDPLTRKYIYNQIISGNGKYDCDDKLAHQIVNTFLFNRSDLTSDYWKHHIDEVSVESISPDQLMMSGMPDGNGNYGTINAFPGRQSESSSYYDAITDYMESGGYYYNLENDLPVGPVPGSYQTPCLIPSSANGGVSVKCCN